jgi:hypothetical protein
MNQPLVLAFLLLPLSLTAAVDPPLLGKDEAEAILNAQQYKSITVIAVVNGVSVAKVASSSLSHVLALAWRDGKWADLHFDVYYDRELGWFTYERCDRMYRIWTRDGYREIRPSSTGW